jgi:GntR family transcriptional regulator
MDTKWSDEQPIYRQLRDRVVAMILEHAIAEGDALPSARTVAAEYKINHLTVLKAYQELSDEGLVENRRGLGLFVTPGARERLLRAERKRFLQEEWPRVLARMHRLGLSPEELLREKATAPGARARGR